MCSFLITCFLLSVSRLDYANYYLKPRGPDATNVAVVEGWTFVHNLLSMTGEPTLQPFTSQTTSIVALFNGEIYNWKTIAAEENIEVTSDGHVLVPLYEKYGVEMFHRFDGEFAIVVCDFEKRIIISSTDVFGTKPLWHAKWYAPKDTAREKMLYATSTYQSSLLRLGATVRETEMQLPNTIRISSMEDSSNYRTLTSRDLHTFDLKQHKMHTNDWSKAFQAAVHKRIQFSQHPTFAGLSDGYDSGAVVLGLMLSKHPFISCTVMGREDPSMIAARLEHGTAVEKSNIKVLFLSDEDVDLVTEGQWLKEKMEPYRYAVADQ